VIGDLQQIEDPSRPLRDAHLHRSLAECCKERGQLYGEPRLYAIRKRQIATCAIARVLWLPCLCRSAPDAILMAAD
jgi:hypothetical protein